MAELAVIGLGMFGRSVALSLAQLGESVLVIDSDPAEVDRVAADIDSAVCADATDEEALRELKLERMSCVVVAIGAESMEASILATALLRQIGVPRIVARSLSELHARVLHAVGAHEVVSPEVDVGRRLARRLAQPNILDRFELGDGGELAEVTVPQQFVDQSLVALNVRRKFGVTVVAIRRQGTVRPLADGDEHLRQGDVLLVLGSSEAVARLAALA